MKTSTKRIFSYLLLSLAISVSLSSHKAHAFFGFPVRCGTLWPAIPSGLPGHPIQVNNSSWTGFISLGLNSQSTGFVSTIYNQNQSIFGVYNSINVVPGCTRIGILYPVANEFDIVGLSPSAATHVRLERTGLNTWRNIVRWNGVQYIQNYSN